MKSKMRFGVCVALLFASIGCASSGWQAEDVPLPRSTPFDSNQMARAAYLEGFRSGYRAQSSGSRHGLELVSGPYLHARRQGFQAGAAQARAQQPLETAPASQVYR